MKKINFAILSSNKLYRDLHETLRKETSFNWIYIDNKENLNKSFLKSNNIKKIFIPHWSNLISKDIYDNFECILFHMTDLPFGRGGSPLQNLIKMEFSETKISALRVVQEIDAGPIYLKENLNLKGNATEIFQRASKIIVKMIKKIIDTNPIPLPQIGAPTFFQRRKPYQSEILHLDDLKSLYDHIRMLDNELYPRAFLNFHNFKIVFEKATFNNKDEIICNVRIFKK